MYNSRCAEILLKRYDIDNIYFIFIIHATIYIYSLLMKNSHHTTTPTDLYHGYVQKYVDEARKIKDNSLLHADIKKAVISAGAKAVKENDVYHKLKT